MIGLALGITIFLLKTYLEASLWETLFIESAQILAWWYAIWGICAVTLAILAWAGDLGAEGARLRTGIATPLGWLIGLSRVPVSHPGVILFLLTRRLLFFAGAYFLTLGVRAVGALFVQDELYIAIGGICIILSLVMGLFTGKLKRIQQQMPTKKPWQPLSSMGDGR